MSGFVAQFGRPADIAAAGPGRVNLIGEHTDYNDGFVLPFAIDRAAVVSVRRRDDGLVRCASAQQPDALEVSLTELPRDGWAAYPLGVAWALREAGVVLPGFDLFVDSTVPVGSGLSSSAAVETATGLALLALAGQEWDPMALALACHRAETEWVGAPVGVMDQVVSACATDGHALLLDCRTLATEHVPLDLAGLGCSVLVIDTKVRHRNVDGAYARRRAACEQASAELGVAKLRDAALDDLDALGPALRRAARHVVTENARVLDATVALRDGDAVRLGRLLSASHASLRDDFEVSCPELDLAVDTAVSAGALGARLTGAGFGGCAIALVPTPQVDAVTRAVTAAFAEHRLLVPDVFTARPSAGAATRPVRETVA